MSAPMFLCFGCYATDPCKCSDAWKNIGRFARDQAWQVKLPLLANNIAICAALCEAFKLGDTWGAWTEDPYPDPAPWRPGCNRNAR